MVRIDQADRRIHLVRGGRVFSLAAGTDQHWTRQRWGVPCTMPSLLTEFKRSIFQAILIVLFSLMIGALALLGAYLHQVEEGTKSQPYWRPD